MLHAAVPAAGERRLVVLVVLRGGWREALARLGVGVAAAALEDDPDRE